MTQQQLLQSFSSLPETAQRQVVEFISSLKQKASPATDGAEAINFSANPFVGMWKDREDLADSTAWVRNVRRKEW